MGLNRWLWVGVVGALIVTMGGNAAERDVPRSCVPDTRDDWSKDNSALLTKQAQTLQPAVLFLGDSITHLWSFAKDNRFPGGKEVWEERIAPLNAANFGIAGDRTEHLLWRITEGKQLEQMRPQVIVLLIGTNNLHQIRPETKNPDTPDDIAAGIAKIVGVIRKKQPQATLLLFGLFPRGFRADTPLREKIRQVNDQIAKLADGGQIRYIDMQKNLLEPDGSATAKILRDELHLSPEGYARWADVLCPVLTQLLKQPTSPEAAQPR